MGTPPVETRSPPPVERNGPPPAPELPRRIRMRPLHWIGMAIITAIPACAAFGLFGSTGTAGAASSSLIELTVDYPTRCRYEMIELLEVRVRNRSGQTIEQVTVVFDPSYLNGFTQAQFTPSPERAFEVELKQLKPGETQLISAEIQGERYGRYSGEIAAKTGAESASVEVSTFIFP